MNKLTPRSSQSTLTVFTSCLLSFLIVMMPLGALAASMRPATRIASGAPNTKPEPAPARGADTRFSSYQGLFNLFAPALAVTATLRDTLTDSNANGLADKGETISYDAVITNNSGGTLSNVNFTDTPDANTTFTGSISLSPIALNDTYQTIGNVQIQVAAAQGIISNDLNPNPTGTLTVTKVNGNNLGGAIATTHGSVTMSSDGSFTYTPNVGDRAGSDSFTYTLDNGTGMTDTATVTINLSGMIWFINNAAGAGDGRLSSPFNSLSSFQTVNDGVGAHPAANDSIFLYESSTAYTGPVTLLSSQKLIGQDATASLLAITGLSTPSGSSLLPAMNSANGTIVKITSGSNAINLTNGSAGNTIRGLTVGNTTGAGINGTSFGTLTVADVDISDTSSRTGQALNLSTGTLAATFTSIYSTNSSATGLTLNAVAGSFAVTGTTSVTNSVSTAVNLTSNTGTLTFAALNITNTASNQTGLNATENTNTITTTSGTINTGTATAVNISKASGATPLSIALTSVSSNGGTATGISLTRTSGSFTVNGDGSNTSRGGNASGGTIANKDDGGNDNNTAVGTAVSLNNATNVTLRRMQFNDLKNYGIRGLSVTGFTLQFSTINGANGDTTVGEEGNIAFGATNPGGSNGLSGTNTIDNCKISGAVENNMDVYNQSGTFNLTVSNSDIKNNSVATGNEGIEIEMQGTAGTGGSPVTITIQNCAFDNNKSQPAHIAAIDNSEVNVTITGNTLQRTSQGNEGFLIINASNAKLTGHITNNTITGIDGVAIFAGSTAANATSSSSLTVVISNNTITHGTGALNSAIIFFPSSTVGQVAPSNVTISNNTVTENSTTGVARGIFIDTPDSSTTPSFTATVNNNNVSIGDNVAGLQGIVMQARRGTGCFRASGNTVTFPNGTPAGVSGIRIRQVSPGAANLEKGVSSSTVPTTVLTDNNPGTTNDVVGTVTVVNNGTCQPAAASIQSLPEAINSNPVLTADAKDSVNKDNNQSQKDGARKAKAAAQTFAGEPGVVASKTGEPASDIISLSHAKSRAARTSHSIGARAINNAALIPPGGNVSATIPTLPNGKSVTIRFTVTVNNTLTGTSKKISTQGTFSGSFGSQVTDDPDTGTLNDATDTPLARTDLTMTSKSDGATSTTPGSTLTYTLSYKNSGRSATGVTLTETVPTGTTFNAGASTAGWSCAPDNNAGSTCTLTVGALAAAAIGTKTFAVTVNNPAPAGLNTIQNTASIADDGTYEADIIPADNSASDTDTTLNAAPAFGTFTKSDGVASAVPGDTLTYTINYANTGNQDATGVVLTETVPAGTTFVAAGSSTWTGCSNGAAAGTVCTIAVGSLAGGGGGSGSATFKVQVNNPVAAGLNNIVNNASITDDGANSLAAVTANASDTDTLNAVPDLAITKTADVANASADTVITYTLNYSNSGTQGATGVTITEMVPSNTTFVAAGSSTGWSCADASPAGTTCTNNVGTVAGGGGNGSLTFKVKVVNPVPGGTTQIQNVATIDDDHANGTDPNTANNTTGNVNTPVCQSSITVTSTADNGSAGTLRKAIADACPGATIDFNIAGAGPHTITLATGQMVIDKNLTIQNTSGKVIIVNGNNASRIFTINSGKVVAISNLNLTGGNDASSGAIQNSGTLTLKGMAIYDNVSTGDGGALRNDGTLTIHNSTLSGNKAAVDGGAILAGIGTTTTLLNVTISNNQADSDNNASGTGGAINNAGTLNVRNSILAGNTAGLSPSNIFQSLSNGSTNDQGNNILSGDPKLAALAFNGGPTKTHALLPGSPALDAGDNTAATTAGLTTDQRGTGFPRIADSADADSTATVDIGAFEAHPTIENITDQSTNEDTALPITFNVGDNSAGFTSVTATSSNTSLVTSDGAHLTITGAGSTRTLTITPNTNANSTANGGTTTITVTVTATNGQTATDTFDLTVNAVNDPPSFVKGADQTVNEDAGAQTVNGWATSISQGPNETGQTLTFNVSVTGTTGNLSFSSGPAIDSSGNLTYTPAADTNGTATISVTLSDNGSNVAPNSNTSAAQTFTITVNSINDPPSFTKGPDQNINESAGAQTVNGWATSISQGPNETGQTLTFNVSVTGTTGNLSFSSAPAINATNGNLTYTANNSTNGTATVSVTLSDNGSNVAPNSNTSAPQTFTITVGAINDPPVNTVPGALNIPQDTVLNFAGPNQISVADPDAAEAPSDGVIRVSLTATNGTLTLSGTGGLNFACGGCAGDGTADATMTFEATLPNINTALNGMKFTPNTGYNGPASVQIISNDLGKTGSGGVKTDTDSVSITVDPLAPIYINEVLFNPPGTDAPNEYIELRGTPGATIPAGTYFVAIEGDAADNPGDVQTIINLSGLSFGSNGFLVLLQNGNTYTTAAGATVVTSTTTGFGGLPGGIWQADSAVTDIEDSSVTFMLIQTGTAPTLTDDIDSNNDGLTDGAAFAGWSVRDSISAMNSSANARAYGAYGFRNAAGSGTSTGTETSVNFIPSYVGRIGDSTGSTSSDWVASGALGGAAPNWTLGTSTETEPTNFAGKLLNHIGASNFTNLAPVNTVPAAQNVNEDTALTFNAANANLISVDDPDVGSADLKVTLTATNGVITLSGTGGLSFACVGCAGDGTADATMTFTGTKSNINTALNGMTFTPASNYFGPASVQIITNDQGNTGVGGAKTDTDTVSITVNAVNDPPSFVKGANQTVNEDAGAQTVNGWATSISQGPGESGQTLTFNVSVTGTTGNLSFSSAPAIDPATGNLSYTTAADTNGTASISVTLSDNGSNTPPNSNTSAAQTFTITVNAVNDAPSFQIASNPTTINEDDGAQTVNSFATNFKPGPATATDETSQTLVGYTVTQTGTTGGLTFTSGPSINTAGTLTYTPAANASGTATFNVVATDSGSGTAPNVNQSAPVSFTITVNAQNDAPVLDNTGNMSLNAINEDVAATSNSGTLVSDIIASAGGDRITDIDTGAVEGIAVTGVDNTNGTWEYSTNNGTNWTAFGSPSGAVARLLASNASTRIRFLPNANFNGTVSTGITFRAWDQTSGSNGNTADTSVNGGTTAFSTATETASITVNPVNDPPTANGQSVSTNEDTPKAITLTGSDVETASANLTFNITQQPAHGTLTGTGANRTYTPAADYNGPDSFKFTVTDTGDGASPALTSAEATVTITVNAVNDAPVNTVPASQSTVKNSALLFNAANSNLISIADVDAGTNPVQVSLTATNGKLTLSSTAGLSFTSGDGTSNTMMVFTGTISNINAALNGMSFAPTPGYDGPASIQIITNDQGNVGAGGALSDTDTINISVLKGGVLAFSSATYTVGEADGTATITVSRTNGSNGTTRVDYATSNGTATAGQDYTATSGQLVFNNGETTKTFTVAIINDALNEAAETINLTLSNITGSGDLGSPATAVLTITDDDPQPSLSINDVTKSEGNSGTTPFTFTVTLSTVSGQAVTVNYATADGTATAPSDYQAQSGTLTFNPGETSKTITVLVNGDTLAEPDEAFTVTLSSAANASIVRATGTGTISSDDTPLVQFSSSSYSVNEDGLRATIIVKRLGDLSKVASVDYATSDPSGLNNCSQVTGSASSRCDYATSVGTLRFNVGEDTRSILIPIVNDVYVEGAELFTITLSNSVGADLGAPVVATVTINDNDNGAQANPIDNDAFFVRQLYIDLLGREPEPAGLQAWLDILHNTSGRCQVPTDCDRIAVALGFVKSQEFQERGYFIFRFYKTALGRDPRYSEFIPDMARVSGFLSGQNLQDNKEAFIAQFMERQEFRSLYDPTIGSPMSYVDKLLQTVGLPNHPSRNSWIAGLSNNTLTRGQVLRQLVESDEVTTKYYNHALIFMHYFGFLRRDPDASFQTWVDTFNHSNDYRIIINGFINSPEYRFRFGP